jgi:hypothetical protein
VGRGARLAHGRPPAAPCPKPRRTTRGGRRQRVARNGRFTELPNAPGAERTVHRGLNDRGETAGIYIDDGVEPGPDGLFPPSAVHGFIYTRNHKPDGRFRVIETPGAQVALPYDVNNRGQIVGVYLDQGAVPGPDGLPTPGAQHAFLWDRGEVTILDPPDTVDAPNAYTINDRGQIVGVRIDESGNQIGFLRQPDGRYVTLDPPGAAQTRRSVSTTGARLSASTSTTAPSPGPTGATRPGPSTATCGRAAATSGSMFPGRGQQPRPTSTTVVTS